eukprot:Opistho-2@59812
MATTAYAYGRPPPPPQSQPSHATSAQATTHQGGPVAGAAAGTDPPAIIAPNRLPSFLAECLRTGVVSGFKHFRMYLRGREELLVTVYNDRATPHHSRASSAVNLHKAPSFRTLFSGHGENSPAPASPSMNEGTLEDPDETAFLLAAYARYKCPYVWLRTNHRRLLALTSPENSVSVDRDRPVRLRTTEEWKVRDVKAWEIIAEIVRVGVRPPPSNPFAIDRAMFSDMSSMEVVLATGALLNFLIKVYTSPECTFSDKVLEDIRFLLRRHPGDLTDSFQAGFPQSPR